AELALPAQIIDLEHHTIYLVGQTAASLADVPAVVQAAVDTRDQPQLPADRHSPVPQPMQYAALGRRQLPPDTAYAVTAALQATTGSDARVHLPQGAGRRTARVGEGLARGFPAAGVQPLEAGPAAIARTPHLQNSRPAFPARRQRDVAHGTHIGG